MNLHARLFHVTSWVVFVAAAPHHECENSGAGDVTLKNLLQSNAASARLPVKPTIVQAQDEAAAAIRASPTITSIAYNTSVALQLLEQMSINVLEKGVMGEPTMEGAPGSPSLPLPIKGVVVWSFWIVLGITSLVVVYALARWAFCDDPDHEADVASEPHNNAASASEIRCLGMLQFVWGFAWAVQRPQGFNIVVYSSFGIPATTIGLISMCGMFANIFGAPACGLLADMVPPNRLMWVYNIGFFWRTLFHMLTWPAMAFLKGRAQECLVLGLVVLSMFWETSGILHEQTVKRVGGYNFGRLRLCAGVGFGMGSLLTGTCAKLVPSLDLRIVYLESAAVCIINTITISCMGHAGQRQEVDEHHDDKTTRKQSVSELISQAAAFLAQRQIALFFCIVLVMGLCEGVMMSYTYLRILLLPHGTPTVMGLSTICMIVSEVPFFYYSGSLMKRFGLMKILGFALVCIFLRQAWNAILADAWLLLPGELLHGITFSIANAAIVDHCSKIAPEGLGSTVQSLQLAIYQGMGQGGGAFVGGLVAKAYGVVMLFAASAYFALAWAPFAAALKTPKAE